MKNSYFLSQPHQPFFVLAFVNAIVLMLMFMLSYKGILPLDVDIVTFHAFGLIHLVFTPAFFAFLFTTFPRFLSTPVVLKSKYIRIFSIYVIATICFIVGSIISPILYKIALVLASIAFLYSFKILFDIFRKSTVSNKHDTFYILIGASFGMLSLVLFLVTPFITLAIQVSVFLYLFVLAFSVAQRMIPFFSQCRFIKDPNFLKYIITLLITHLTLELVGTNFSFVVDFILAVYIGKELLRWKLPFPNPNPMMWILHLALYWVPIAFLLSAISNGLELFYDISFLALAIHSLMLGFLLTVLIGFGTRVTLGHSGNKMIVNKLTKFIFILTQVVVMIRIITSIIAGLGFDYMIVFDITITFWLMLFLGWAWQFLKVLTHGKKLRFIDIEDEDLTLAHQ
ncbi:NnrS family protein [Arcobacteraceae bacterium]|nr:NnrS family protein [Arcobacteraceae bacterium]